MDHLNLNEYLVDVVENKTNKIVYDRDVEEFLASFCTNYINDFVVNVGFNFMSDNKIEEFKKIANDFKINFNELTHDETLIKKEELTFIFEGRTSLNDFYKVIGEEYQDSFEEVKGEAETIGGLVLEHAGRILKNNEFILIDKVKFIVESSDKKRMKTIKIKLP